MAFHLALVGDVECQIKLLGIQCGEDCYVHFHLLSPESLTIECEVHDVVLLLAMLADSLHALRGHLLWCASIA